MPASAGYQTALRAMHAMIHVSPVRSCNWQITGLTKISGVQAAAVLAGCSLS